MSVYHLIAAAVVTNHSVTPVGAVGYIEVLGVLVGIVIACAVAFAVFRSKAQKESTALLRDLNQDLFRAYDFEKQHSDDLEKRNERLEGLLHDEVLKAREQKEPE